MGQRKDNHGQSAAQKQVDAIAGIPTTPHPTLWQYTSTHYDAESSLPTLSLVPSTPGTPSRPARASNIDRIVTQPPPRRSRHIDEIDTRPPRKQMWLEIDYEAASTAMLPRTPVARPEEFSRQQRLVSWTAGRGANSRYARRIVEPERKRGRGSSGLHPFDSLRWWLLYPGRIEFLLWVTGALGLILLSALLLPLTFFSVMASPGAATNASSRQAPSPIEATVTSLCVATPQGSSACDAVRVTSPTGLEITLLNTSQARDGAPLQLRGRGFTALSMVSFTCDTHWQCRPGSLRVDARGAFTANLMPAGEADWMPGWHQIMVNDTVTHHSLSLPFTLLTTAPATTASPTTSPSSPDATPAIQEEPTQIETSATSMPTPAITPHVSPIDSSTANAQTPP